MSRYIDADALYERLKADEELAMDRVIDTPNSFPNGAVNPSAIRYMAQLNERTRFKEIVFDAPTIEKTEWIPVTERLPKESDGKVLITVSGEVETGKYSEFSKTWFIGVLNGVGGDDPIAWMPLPKPWNEAR